MSLRTAYMSEAVSYFHTVLLKESQTFRFWRQKCVICFNSRGKTVEDAAKMQKRLHCLRVVDGIGDEGDAESAELIDGQEDVSRASRRARAKSGERAAIINCPSRHWLRSDDGATTLGVS